MVLTTPLPGDLLVRLDEDPQQYSVVQADTGKLLAGPFDEERYATGVAVAMARMRNVRAWTSRKGQLVMLS